jgi:hypothetical protein
MGDSVPTLFFFLVPTQFQPPWMLLKKARRTKGGLLTMQSFNSVLTVLIMCRTSHYSTQGAQLRLYHALKNTHLITKYILKTKEKTV